MSITFIDPMVVRSLNKSKLRKKILYYLYKIYPNATYLSEISRGVKSDPSNVLGCLKGLNGRYNGHFSLIELGLVECKEYHGMKLYKLTEYGKKIVELLIDQDNNVISSLRW
ncbi:helix-turn-helix domain-containing protein [Methanocaldococcus sp.]